jgi:RND family efflux transporter MFP subunit
MTKKPVLAIMIAAALLAVGCGRTKPETTQAAEVVRNVRLLEVQPMTVTDYMEAVGTVRALETSQLSAQTAGTIVAVRAQEGQHVHKGDVLVTLDDAQQRAAVERATAAIAAAREDLAAGEAESTLDHATLVRYQSLFDKKSVSPHEMDEVQARAKMSSAHQEQARAGLAQAQAAEAQARAAQSFTRIRAPFDGIVTARQLDPGALATPGVPLLTIENTSRFRLEASVNESAIRLVKVGTSTMVAIDAFDSTLAGKVVQIVPAADPASRSFVVKVELSPDARLRSGLFGRVRFANGERQTILLPKTAVLDRGQLQAVYAISQTNLASLRVVTLGKHFNDQVEILSGLQPGDRIVAEPRDRELAGKQIERQL